MPIVLLRGCTDEKHPPPSPPPPPPPPAPQVTLPSAKNVQLVVSAGGEGAAPSDGSEDDPRIAAIALQFGRVGPDAFTLDYSWPLCLVHAVHIAVAICGAPNGLVG